MIFFIENENIDYHAKNTQNCEKIQFCREFFVSFRTLFVDIKLKTVKFTATMWFKPDHMYE